LINRGGEVNEIADFARIDIFIHFVSSTDPSLLESLAERSRFVDWTSWGNVERTFRTDGFSKSRAVELVIVLEGNRLY
jgi:hypothetical protein